MNPSETIRALCENHPTIAAYIQREARRVKLDLDLIKEILIEVEKLEVTIPQEISIKGQDPIKVSRHIEMLYDDGLIEGIAVSGLSSSIKEIMIKDMSYRGHGFLAAMREDTIWGQIKSVMKPEALAAVSIGQVATLTGDLVLKTARNAIGLD